MKDILTELENTEEILGNKLLDIQELVYYHYKTPWKCHWCGFTVKPHMVPTFEIYKDIIDGHSRECTRKHMLEYAEKHKNDKFDEKKLMKMLEKLKKPIVIRVKK